MRKALVERNIALALFVLVLIVFSFAERDSRKLRALYLSGQPASAHAASTTAQAPASPDPLARWNFVRPFFTPAPGDASTSEAQSR